MFRVRYKEKGSAVVFVLIILVVAIIGVAAVAFLSGNRRSISGGSPKNLTGGNLKIDNFTATKPYGILEIGIAYDSTVASPVSIGTITNKLGFSPRLPAYVTPFKLQLVDSDGKIVYAAPLGIPNAYPDDAALTNPLHQGSVIVEPKVAFPVVVPAITGTATVRVVDATGNAIAIKKLPNGIGGQPTLTYATAAQPQASSFYFLLISDAYTQAQLDEFHNDAQTFKSYLESVEPFSNHTSQMQFNTIDNTTDLNCAPPPNAPPNSAPLICDINKVLAQVDASNLPHDVVVVIVKADRQEGAWDVGTPYSFVSNGGPAPAHTFQHEMGHDFGALYDEYVVGTTGAIDNTVDKNCLKGSPPAAVWQGLVSSGDYNQGCYNTNWYRSSSQSIMSTTGVSDYNAVSKKIIEERFASLPGGPGPSSIASSSATPSSTPVSTQAPGGDVGSGGLTCHQFAPSPVLPVNTGQKVCYGFAGDSSPPATLPDIWATGNSDAENCQWGDGTACTCGSCNQGGPAGNQVFCVDYKQAGSKAVTGTTGGRTCTATTTVTGP